MRKKEIYWLNEDSRTFLKRGYLSENETPEQRIRVIAETAEKYLRKSKTPEFADGFADKLESYIHKGWYSLSTPVWIGFGTNRGLGISCFNSHISDSVESFLLKQAEVGYMTKIGGGTSGYFGDIRPRGSKISTGGTAEGAVRAMELFYNVTNIISQGSSRRGHFAAYLPIDHGDIEEFLQIRSEGHTIQEMSIGVCVSNNWMESMLGGDKEKRRIWGLVIKKRFETGYPYVFFTDNTNDQAPQPYKDKGLRINAQNMCAEICLASDAENSFVCDLSSMNLLKWEEWKDTDAVQVLTYLLDTVMSEFIEKTDNMPLMKAPNNFAKTQRALGIGVLGWHSLLQDKMISFESMEAKFLNSLIFKTIKERTDIATRELAVEFGEPELCKGYGIRNVTTIAVAPTTSSSFILGQVSPSIEPLHSNFFTKDLSKIKFTFKNPKLKEVLASKEKDTDAIWKSILLKGGSVQHLDCLTQEEKDVFKTFGEISQKEIIIQASTRQKWICQGQSLNVMIHPDTKPKDVNELMVFAWKNNIKSLYYQRGTNKTQELNRSLLECKSCEG
jgi:ribonucleoside-diphosphate reductase alpha chain